MRSLRPSRCKWNNKKTAGVACRGSLKVRAGFAGRENVDKEQGYPRHNGTGAEITELDPITAPTKSRIILTITTDGPAVLGIQ